LALAFQESVGSDRGAHAHLADTILRDRFARCQAEDAANAMDSGIAIGGLVVREHLRAVQNAIRRPAEHIGKGAAAVDPEIPKLMVHRLISTHFVAAVIIRRRPLCGSSCAKPNARPMMPGGKRR